MSFNFMRSGRRQLIMLTPLLLAGVSIFVITTLLQQTPRNQGGFSRADEVDDGRGAQTSHFFISANDGQVVDVFANVTSPSGTLTASKIFTVPAGGAYLHPAADSCPTDAGNQFYICPVSGPSLSSLTISPKDSNRSITIKAVPQDPNDIFYSGYDGQSVGQAVTDATLNIYWNPNLARSLIGITNPHNSPIDIVLQYKTNTGVAIGSSYNATVPPFGTYYRNAAADILLADFPDGSGRASITSANTFIAAVTHRSAPGWSFMAECGPRRTGHQTVYYRNNQNSHDLLITIGGEDYFNRTPVLDTYIYDLTTQTCTKGSPIPAQRCHFAAAVAPGNGNDEIYVFSGMPSCASSINYYRSLISYNPNTGVWRTVSTYPVNYVSYIKHNATYCPYSNAENVISSKIYFLGGETLYNRSFLAYDLKGQRWIRDNSYQPNIDLGVPIELAEIPHSNYYPLHVTGVCLDQAGTSNIYYWTYNNTNNYFYKYSVGHNNWETLSYVPLNYSFPRFGFAKNSRAHFVGGGNTVGSNTVSVFDPVNGMWSVSTIGGLPMGNGTMGLGFNPANQFISSGSFLQRYDLTQLPTPTIVITPPPVVTPTFTPTPTPTTLPTLIPNSDKIVYTSTPPNQGDNIYIMNADGTNKTRLTEGADASLSPNGNQITFHSNKLGGTNVYIMNVDGSNVRALTNTTDWVNMNATPAFSPDGTRIAFMSVLQVQNPSDKPNIKTMDSSNGGAIYNLTSDVTNYAYTPHYSPDGTKIVYRATVNNGSSNDIFIMDAANGNHKINITNNHPIDEYSPVFSPDGNRIAFESNRDGNNEIYIMDINGNNPTRITNHPKNDRDPSFSPDGKFVVFNSDRDGDYEIFMVDINAGTLFQLTSNSYPDISPSFITPQGPIDITTCATDCDCVCGYPNGSSQCTYLNKLYADPNSRLTCSMTPDFCTGISGTGNPACINGRCAFRDNYPVNCASSKN